VRLAVTITLVPTYRADLPIACLLPASPRCVLPLRFRGKSATHSLAEVVRLLSRDSLNRQIFAFEMTGIIPLDCLISRLRYFRLPEPEPATDAYLVRRLLIVTTLRVFWQTAHLEFAGRNPHIRHARIVALRTRLQFGLRPRVVRLALAARPSNKAG